MNLNVDFDPKLQMALLTFETKEFQKERDYAVAISIISTFSADFDLDPELEKEDIESIIEKAQESENKRFIFEICEDGIEVSF